MGRRPIGEVPMTPAERQRRRRAKLAAIVRANDVLDRLERDYQRAYLTVQAAIRRGVEQLLAKWRKADVEHDRAFNRMLRRRKRRKVSQN
jgi:hypothetical protein